MKNFNVKDNNISMFSIVNSFRDNVRHEPMVSLNNPFELLALVNKIGFRVILACFNTPVKITKRQNLLVSFTMYLFKMNKNHGEMYTVKYLKSCTLAIQKTISKDVVKTLRELEPTYPLPRLSTSGLPRVIPLVDRRAILSGNVEITRY
jgi:hypothetical protein